MKPFDVGLVIRLVLRIFRERRCRWSLIRDLTDLWLDPELRKIREQAAVEIRDGQAVKEREVFGSSVAGVDLQRVITKVELDLKVPTAERDRAGGQSSWTDIQRHVPPAIKTRVHRE